MLGSRRVIHYTCWIDPKRLWRHLTALWLSTLVKRVLGTVKVSPSVVWIGMKRLWRPLTMLWLSILKMPISGLGGDTYSES